ncbi:MAG: peptide chain release factor N(5)-glutamine methyltransferase [Chloroflexota bacterium]
MTLKDVLFQARQVLTASQIEDAALESEVMLRHVLMVSRSQLYVDFNRELNPTDYLAYWDLVKRRLDNEPIAYMTGHREFYGLDFYVEPAVLITRPESELLVERALQIARNRHISKIADIGTGSGAIAISLALNLRQATIYATDISASALQVALINCRKHGVTERVRLLEGDLLDPLPEPVDLIVANLPYVRESELSQVNTGGFEPPLALNGGQDGLDKIRRLCIQAGKKLRPEGCLLLEIGEGQSSAISDFLSDLFPSSSIEVTPDLAGIERVITVTT